MQRTDDGAIWIAYGGLHTDEDVILRETCTTGIDPYCSCTPAIVTDRSVGSLYLARAATANASSVDVRFQARLIRSAALSNAGSPAAHIAARGSKVYIADDDGNVEPTLFRYLVLDITRL